MGLKANPSLSGYVHMVHVKYELFSSARLSVQLAKCLLHQPGKVFNPRAQVRNHAHHHTYNRSVREEEKERCWGSAAIQQSLLGKPQVNRRHVSKNKRCLSPEKKAGTQTDLFIKTISRSFRNVLVNKDEHYHLFSSRLLYLQSKR